MQVKGRLRFSQYALFLIFLLLLGIIFWFMSNLNIHRLLTSLSSAVLPATPTIAATTQGALTDNSEYSYGVIIDAGSSGSRLYVYTWPPHSGDRRDLLNISLMRDEVGQAVVKKVTPGLSSFENNPTGAMNYLRPLLDLAASSVPSKKHKETPLYVLATAGMRLLSQDAQSMILDELRLHIRLGYNFLFSEQHVQVITGKQEGVFGWIATNYLLGRFEHSHSDGVAMVHLPKEQLVDQQNSADSPTAQSATVGSIGSRLTSAQQQQQQQHRKRTVGVMDMGGASMQIAFELEESSPSSVPVPDEYVATFNLGSRDHDTEHTYSIYVTTFLGFGANVARERYEKMLYQDRVSRFEVLRKSMTPSQSFNSTNTGNITESLNSSVIASVGSSSSGVVPRRLLDEIVDPCLPQGLSHMSPMKWLKKSQRPTPLVTFKGSGDFSQCIQQATRLLGREKVCPRPPCSIGAVFQPPIDYAQMEFYGFSEFWYSTADILKGSNTYSYIKYFDSAKNFCLQDWLTISANFRSGVYPHNSDLAQLKLQCHKAAWVTSVLHSGLQFPQWYSKLHTVETIRGIEVQWSLGAMLYHTRYMPLRDIQRRELMLQAKRLYNSRTRLPEVCEVALFVTALLFLGLILLSLHKASLLCTAYRVRAALNQHRRSLSMPTMWTKPRSSSIFANLLPSSIADRGSGRNLLPLYSSDGHQ